MLSLNFFLAPLQHKAICCPYSERSATLCDVIQVSPASWYMYCKSLNRSPGTYTVFLSWGFKVGVYLRQAFTRDGHLLISWVLHVDAFATLNLIMVSPRASNTFSSVIRGHHVYKETWTFVNRLWLRVFPLFFSTVSFSFWEHHSWDSLYAQFKLSSSYFCALPFSCYKISQLENDIVALTRHDQASFYTRGPYTTEHTQAWIQDWRLLKNFREAPCIYLRHAFIQMRLLFKDFMVRDWQLCILVGIILVLGLKAAGRQCTYSGSSLVGTPLGRRVFR